MFIIIGLYIFLMYYKYNKAREQGTVQEWRIKIINIHLWAISSLLFVYAILICYLNYIIQDKWAPLKWEPALLLFLSITISPLFIRKMQRINKTAAVLVPAMWAMVCIIYIPFTTGCSFLETIIITCIGVLGMFFLAAGMIWIAILFVILIFVLVAYLCMPVVFFL